MITLYINDHRPESDFHLQSLATHDPLGSKTRFPPALSPVAFPALPPLPLPACAAAAAFLLATVWLTNVIAILFW
jgi:hypothetical protein